MSRRYEIPQPFPVSMANDLTMLRSTFDRYARDAGYVPCRTQNIVAHHREDTHPDAGVATYVTIEGDVEDVT